LEQSIEVHLRCSTVRPAVATLWTAKHPATFR